MKKIIIQVVLLAIIIFLVYKIYESIMEPVRFNKEKDHRMEQVVQNLKDIRAAQMAYKSIYGKYAPNFDTLLNFIEIEEIPVVKMIPDPNDTTFTRSIMDTLGYISVLDSLYNNRPNFKLGSLPLIPFAEGDTFLMDAGEIERSKLMIKVFEASSLNNQFLKGLDQQLVNNFNDKLESTDRFPGLKVGSMSEATTDGNWE